MKVALLQLNAGFDKKANIKHACGMAEEAIGKGAEFVLLPEMFNGRMSLERPEGLPGIAEAFPGPSTKPLMDLAGRTRVFILAGSVVEKIRGTHKAYNASALIGPDGAIRAVYRKINLFDAVLGKKIIKESRFFAAGKRLVNAMVGTFRVGMTICYDLRFPDLYRRYGRQGAHVLVVPSCFTRTTGEAHWEVLLRARAIENQCYVLAPNQVGADGRGIESFGHSMVIGPWGEVIARGSAGEEEILYADISMAAIEHCQRVLPSVRTRN